MGQKKNFIVEKKKKVESITELLIKLLPEFNINFKNRAGFKSRTRPIDFALYDLIENEKKIGCYEYRLKEDVYQCLLDLTGTDVVKYETIMKTLKSKYPKYFSCDTEKLNLN